MKEKINEVCAVICILSAITLSFMALYLYIEKTSLEIEKLKYELDIYKESKEMEK